MQDIYELIRRFARENEALQEPARALDMCGVVTHKFCRFLRANDFAGSLVDVSWNRRGHRVVDGPPIPPHILDIFFQGHTWFQGHVVALVDDTLYVDFTARQFDPDSKWPLVWETYRVRNTVP